MQAATRGRWSRTTSVTLLAVTAAFLAACTTPEPRAMLGKKTRSKEFFSESEYGVKASPRVSTLRTRLPRGGGREQLGKPYKVRGKWYHPKEDRDYRKVGMASWYGDAFHGRLTANGEIYDMTHLTAAHPTMPLPSYARVTNTENGSSIVVRVNDRGPYSHGRIIDLSHRAAELLDYTRTGTAKVKVEYVGRAPLHGHDEQYLMASYRPGNAAPQPSDGLPDGVMIAMNGPTPSLPVSRALTSAFPGELTDAAAASLKVTADAPLDIPLPEMGPIAPERPSDILPKEMLVASATMSYAAEPVSSAASAFAALEGGGASAAPSQDNAIVPYVAIGAYSDAAEAETIATVLSNYGRVRIEASQFEAQLWHSVSLYPVAGASIDELLQMAWEHGAADAFAVRN